MQKTLIATIMALAAISIVGTAFAEQYDVNLEIGQGEHLRTVNGTMFEDRGVWSGELTFNNKKVRVLDVDSVAFKDDKVYIELSNEKIHKFLELDVQNKDFYNVTSGTVTTVKNVESTPFVVPVQSGTIVDTTPIQTVEVALSIVNHETFGKTVFVQVTGLVTGEEVHILPSSTGTSQLHGGWKVTADTSGSANYYWNVSDFDDSFSVVVAHKKGTTSAIL